MNENTLFWKLFYRRSGICFFIIMLLFLSCILRVTSLSTTKYTEAELSQNSIRLTLSKQRGSIFDCNRVPLTNQTKKIMAAVSPTPRAVAAISKLLDGKALEDVLQRLKSGKPVLTEVPKKIKCDGIICTEIYEHSSSKTPAIHLLGYTDGELNGLSGIEKAYNDILFSDSEVYISYECNGKGEILEGSAPKLYKDTSIESSGVVTTIDINIQSIAEAAAEKIDSGAVVIADAKSGKIRASVSRPDFNPLKLQDYLNQDSSPLLNRAINAYNVGSVFKPCVAVTGIENRKKDFSYVCTGSSQIIDRHFKCHKYDGHGFMNLKSAIANSCNTYFYNYAFSIGKDEILNTASALRFGKPLTLCKNFTTAKGNIPKTEALENIAQLANFSIGQGELLLSPISILTLYTAIANDGTYYIPSVVEGTLQNGSFKKYEGGSPTRVMTPDTAKILQKQLESVLTEGTGELAKPEKVTAAGKTATAQTGKYQNGKEICSSWFCGFFPAENPKYTVVIFQENTLKQTVSCGEIFKTIADSIADIEIL